MKLKPGQKRCINALLNRPLKIICADFFLPISIFLATSFVETRISLSKRQSTPNDCEHHLQQHHWTILSNNGINKRWTNISRHLYPWIIPLFSHWSSVQKPSSSFDRESRRKVLDDNCFPRYKRQKIHHQLLDLQHYNKKNKIDTKEPETWGKATFWCPPESTNLAFIESLFKNPPSTKIVSKYQTIWITDFSLNGPDRKNFESTWW